MLSTLLWYLSWNRWNVYDAIGTIVFIVAAFLTSGLGLALIGSNTPK